MGMPRRPRLSLLLPVVLASVFLTVGPARAAVITVTTTAESPGGAGDCTLGEAIQAANTDTAVDACAAGSGADTIMMAAGTYTLTTGLTTSFGVSAFVIATAVTIQGQGAAITRDPVNPNLRFFEVTSAGNLTVNDLGLSNGLAQGAAGAPGVAGDGGPGEPGRGGAIHNSGTLTLSAASLSGNAARGGQGGSVTAPPGNGGAGGDGQGGAIYDVGTLTLLATNLSNNAVQGGGGGGTTNGFGGRGGVGQGGALYHGVTGTLMIAGSTLATNGATGGPGGYGLSAYGLPGLASGGALHSQGAVTITQSTLNANTVVAGASSSMLTAQGRGGAIAVDTATLNLTQSTVSGNTVTGGSVGPYPMPGGPGYGGGLHLQNATVDVSRTAIIDNNAVGGPGPFGAGVGYGGGLYASVGQAALANVTVSGNNAMQGAGGAYVGASGTVTLTHVTLADNTSSNGTAGLVNTAATVTFAGTLVADNAGPGGNCSGPIVNDGGNLQYPGTICGAGIPTANPMLGPLQNDGGSFVHPLPPASPAIDAAEQPGCPATDQRGVMRPIDGDDDGLAVCDTGAYEAAATDLIFRDGFEA